MSEESADDALIVVSCPFCNTTIVEAYDHSILSDDLDDDEREEITCNTCDECDGECEHLAFRSDWAYSGSEVIERWSNQMEKLANAIDAENEDAAETIADAINMSETDLDPIAEEVLPEYEFASSRVYVEKFDGPSSGGPTYMHIFLKHKSI